ncbi:MAG TPA: hypothetical protein H9924_01280 [Candidatus Phocaeicola merdavium]|nr:hypothetical protein [Candidatus Phocaeicola merdavium]
MRTGVLTHEDSSPDWTGLFTQLNGSNYATYRIRQSSRLPYPNYRFISRITFFVAASTR